ncbi:BQ2448_1648 [Microbotryum intermedium]|uniref:BQ2448_1648 protein n=1 Tax=Microbotryum intermedium TaxID=269621 RepID=A0A238FEE7_9BASI|nr:BQ2448_1648 [Microbotryum intermedium]
MLFASTLSALVLLSAQLAPAVANHHGSQRSTHVKARSFEVKINAPHKRDFLRADGTVDEHLIKRTVEHQKRTLERRASDKRRRKTSSDDDYVRVQNAILENAQHLEQLYKQEQVPKTSKTGVASLAVDLSEGHWSTRFELLRREERKPLQPRGGGLRSPKSKTARKLPKKYTFTDRAGNWSGTFYKDTFSFADFTFTQSFVAVETTSQEVDLQYGEFLSKCSSGALSLRRSTSLDAFNPVEILINSLAIPQPLFALRLTDCGGSLDIGKIDPSAYTGVHCTA